MWHLFVSLLFGIATNKWVMCNQRPVRIWQTQDCQLRLALRKRTLCLFFVESLVWGKRSKREMTLFWTFDLAVYLMIEVDGWNGQDSEGGESRGGDVGVPAVPHPVTPVHWETSSAVQNLTSPTWDSNRSWSTQRSPRKMTALKSMTRRTNPGNARGHAVMQGYLQRSYLIHTVHTT